MLRALTSARWLEAALIFEVPVRAWAAIGIVSGNGNDSESDSVQFMKINSFGYYQYLLWLTPICLAHNEHEPNYRQKTMCRIAHIRDLIGLLPDFGLSLT
jgi:hypothetical protein